MPEDIVKRVTVEALEIWRVCAREGCQNQFKLDNANRLHCSSACRQARHKDRVREMNSRVRG